VPAGLCPNRDSLPAFPGPAGMDTHTSQHPGHTMETKDHFMRIAVIASVILVGALALVVRLNT
jgi:hypothetical protein